jgi:hypothetical protein
LFDPVGRASEELLVEKDVSSSAFSPRPPTLN